MFALTSPMAMLQSSSALLLDTHPYWVIFWLHLFLFSLVNAEAARDSFCITGGAHCIITLQQSFWVCKLTVNLAHVAFWSNKVVLSRWSIL